MSYLCTAIEKSSMRPDGGIGRRAGLKHQWIHFHPGSTPGLGTEAEKVEILSPFFFSTPRNSLVIPKFGHDGFARLSLKPWGIALKFLFLHHENILFPND